MTKPKATHGNVANLYRNCSKILTYKHTHAHTRSHRPVPSCLANTGWRMRRAWRIDSVTDIDRGGWGV